MAESRCYALACSLHGDWDVWICSDRDWPNGLWSLPNRVVFIYLSFVPLTTNGLPRAKTQVILNSSSCHFLLLWFTGQNYAECSGLQYSSQNEDMAVQITSQVMHIWVYVCVCKCLCVCMFAGVCV